MENEGQDDKDIAETRWKIFAFIMSFPDKVISALNELPKNYLLIGTTLYALVKVIIDQQILFPALKYQNLISSVSFYYTEWSDGRRRGGRHSLHRIQELRQ